MNKTRSVFFNKTRYVFFKQLKVQIALYYLMASLLMVLLMSVVYYYSASSIIQSDTLNQTIHAVEQSGQDIESFVVGLKQTAMFLSENKAVKDYLITGDVFIKEQAHSVIDQILATNSAIATVVVVGKSGDVVSSESQLEMSVSDDMMKEAWYVNAINNQQMPALTSARLQKFTMDKDTWVIALSQEIFDDSAQHLGVVLIDIKYQVIENYLDHLPLGEAGFSFVMDDDKQVVYHPNPTYFVDNKKKSDLIQMVENKEGYDKNLKILTHHYDIPNTHWTLVGVSSLDQLVVIRRQLVEVVVVISIIILFLIVGGGYLVANRMTKPIKKLQDVMEKFDHTTQFVDIPTSSYEVEQLSFQFNKMLSEIQHLLSEIKEKEQYLRSYELSALYSQINPHFLYNTLDTIVWMAEFNDSEKVIEVTKSLAQFFRISLSKGQEMISLENEIDHITQYLFIQKQRYAEQLNYNIVLPPDLKDIEVPKIILQPIVENAIYHGIREKTEGGTVTVTCTLEGDMLLLSVHDDGVGFEKNDIHNTTKLGGVGLDNVKKRLQLVYGESCQMTISSIINGGTTVTINIPYKQ